MTAVAQPAKPPVLGVLLAGGRSERMGGGDKCLRTLAGRTLLARVIERARPQVAKLVLRAMGDPTRFAAYGLPVINKSISEIAEIKGRGAFASLLVAMEWAAVNAPELPWVASFPTDSPFFPTDLVSRLLNAVETRGVDIACAQCDGYIHPVFGLWPVTLAGELRRLLADNAGPNFGHILLDRRGSKALVTFPSRDLPPFLNINRPEDLATAERLLGEQAARLLAQSYGKVLKF